MFSDEIAATQESTEPAALYIKLALTGCGFIFDGFDSDTSWINDKLLRLALNEYVEEASRIIQSGLRRKAGLASQDDLLLYDVYRFVRIYCANLAVSRSKADNKLKSSYKAVFSEVERYMMQRSILSGIVDLYDGGAFIRLRKSLKKGRSTPWFLSKRKLNNMLKNKGR